MDMKGKRVRSSKEEGKRGSSPAIHHYTVRKSVTSSNVHHHLIAHPFPVLDKRQ